MVTMAGLQVFIVKMFFTGGRKGELTSSYADLEGVSDGFADFRTGYV